MTSYLSYNYKKPSSSQSNSSNFLKKKVKHFSYSSADQIGKGFSSIVYKGCNDLTNETVAIKAIDMKGVKDAISRQMLDCEIQALTTLHHANILKCYDVVRQTSHCYIITQFCNQGDLSDLVKKKKKIAQQQALKILKDIVSGFVQMGERKFLHRDLKLANIFMSDGNAIIADFGFAKKHNNGSEREKYNVGSPLYMSPQALKKNIYSIKNDIWSIGIMAFEMLHGETPWQCRTEKQLIDKMTRIPIKFKESLNISSPTKDFIKKCLEVDQKKRTSLQDLKLWLQGNFSRKALQQIPLLRKPLSNIEPLNNPLSQITNKLSAREQKSRSFGGNYHYQKSDRESFKSRQPKAPKQSKGVSLVSLPKSIIQANNNILVIEINTFRLIYKILEKVRKFDPQAFDLLKSLGSEVLRRVKTLKSFCCDVDENGKSKAAALYGIRQADSYLDQTKNGGIKKYKSVVREYYKKYTTEIKQERGTINCQQLVREYLRRRSVEQTQQLLGIYWMIQYVNMKKDVRKQELDEIIEPKIKINKQYLENRIKELGE